MSEKELIAKNIRNYFKNHENKKIVILPLRDLSGIVRDILREEYGLCEQFLVDNYAFDLEHIFPMDRMPENYKECVFFLAVFGTTGKVLQEKLLEYVPADRIVDLLYDEEREKVFQSDSKVHIDFACPGFAKCGTTSLHYALAQNPKIFLPEGKETWFLRYNINEDTHEGFKKHYEKAEGRKGVIRGMIEPSYRSQADEVYRYCGKDLKLIFCVRNPADVLYSYFKMTMRCDLGTFSSDSMELMMMDEFGRVCPEMFDKWSQKYRYRERYAHYIKTFLEFYPMEQIKIITGEELYADVYNQMNDLQEFLGIAEEDRIAYREFPRENIGSQVVKDKTGLEINHELFQLNLRLTRAGDYQSLELLNSIRDKAEKITMVDYKAPMLESTRQNLLDYYMDSIHELEELLGRSLKNIWY